MNRQAMLVLTSALVLAPATWAADAPLGVSPGESDRMSRVELRCPTFSWGAVSGATAYELVVFELPEGWEMAETWASADIEGARPVLRTTVPGTASSWTPSLHDCLEAGTSNAWFVRAVEAEQPGDWSRARLFEVAPGRPAITLDEAVDVLREHLRSAAAGDRVVRALAPLVGADAGMADPSEVPGEPASATGSGAGGPVSLQQASTTTAPAAISAGLGTTSGQATVGVRGVTHSEEANSAGVFGWATSTAQPGSFPAQTGVYGRSDAVGGMGVRGEGMTGVRGDGDTGVFGAGSIFGVHGSGPSEGVRGTTNSINPAAAGVRGRSSATTGSASGVFGETESPDGTGVRGTAPTGIGGGTGVSGSGAVGVLGDGLIGVRGVSNDAIGTGVVGIGDTASGVVTGVYGEATTGSQDGRGVHAVGSGASVGLRAESVNGNHIEAYESSSSRVFYVDQDGDVFADGSYNCGLAMNCFNAGVGADVAERIDTSEALQPGDVVEIDPERPGHFRRSRGPRSLLVVGVVSTQPAITLNNNDLADNDGGVRTDERPLLALVGKVPVRASAENGAIRPGDFLATASIPGHAARCEGADRCFGRTIGKALEGLAEGTGTVLTMVDLQ